MGKVTFIVEFPDGQEPPVSAGTDILGGKVEMVAWRDISEDTHWRTGEITPPSDCEAVVAHDGYDYHILWCDPNSGEIYDPLNTGLPDIIQWLPVPVPALIPEELSGEI